MKKFILTILFLLMVMPCFGETYVAVVETISENGVIGYSEKLFLTDKLRDRAKKVLPAYMGYTIMTRENIDAMLPEGKKSFDDCKGRCLTETGRNIAADYIAQARVGKFGDQLTLTVELYETRSNKLMGSFTAMSTDAMALLKEIERQADGMFAAITGGNRGSQMGGGAEGFEDLNLGGSGYKARGTKSYIISVASNPSGSVFSVDGRPNADCSKTPCDITLSAGSHRFSFGMKMYFDKDTVFDVEGAGQKLKVNLMPNFGTLELEPQLQSGVGDAGDFVFDLDGERVTGSQFRLAPGRHSVTISHDCYETANFNVNVNSGSDLVFDKPLVAKTGGLKLDVVENGKPKALPVFVNGTRMGKTPFLETVPVCSKVTIGDDREQVPVKLKANETVTYKHELGGGSTFTDSRDGQRYKTVKIGNQTWMAENLNYKTNDSYCYNNDEDKCKKYGRLYEWDAARNACPSGWHLPSNEEWKTLWTAVGGTSTAGTKLKSKNMNGEDSFGFAVLPAGYLYYSGYFNYEGDNAYFWSSTEDNSYRAYGWGFGYGIGDVRDGWNGKGNAFSVRCLRDSDSQSSANVEENPDKSDDFSANVEENPDKSDDFVSFIDSRDGQRYKTVKIGDQVWMAENLNYKTRYSYCYDNNDAMCKKYGRLYKWDAAESACPSGWHLPSNDEWNTLWTAVGGTGTAGTKLKSKSMNGSDSFGFAVLPAGHRSDYGRFYYEGGNAYFWSSTENGSSRADLWYFFNRGDYVNDLWYNKDNAFSVRCLRDSN